MSRDPEMMNIVSKKDPNATEEELAFSAEWERLEKLVQDQRRSTPRRYGNADDHAWSRQMGLGCADGPPRRVRGCRR